MGVSSSRSTLYRHAISLMGIHKANGIPQVVHVKSTENSDQWQRGTCDESFHNVNPIGTWEDLLVGLESSESESQQQAKQSVVGQAKLRPFFGLFLLEPIAFELSQPPRSDDLTTPYLRGEHSHSCSFKIEIASRANFRIVRDWLFGLSSHEIFQKGRSPHSS